MLPLYLVWLVAEALQARGQRSSPIVINPSQEWSGNDGPWSSFPIRVGNPEQEVHVLVSTAVPETWVVLPGGCLGQDPPDCNNSRGTLFFPNQSSTWNESGLLDLSIEQNLDYTDSNNGDYGFDRLGLGSQGSGGPSLQHQVVAGIATKQYYLGNLGVNSKSINLTTFNEHQPSLLSSLKNQGLIPSLSFGYTAGARYHSKRAFGSLTLGGYDASRFIPNDVNFSFGPDNSRDLLVAIQSINTTTISKPSTSLLSKPIYAYVDSTVPHLWLPIDACQAFESAFGIVWDSATDLYLVNESLHDSLLSMNATVTFTLGNGLSGGIVTTISLPYAALDLEVSSPIVDNVTHYFPLRRAANDTQYTLGRTFLQEAYLTVDYERSNFSVSQCNLTENAQQQIISITAADTTSSTASSASSSQSRQGLSPGAIAGIVIAVVIVILAVAIAYYLRRRRQKSAAYEAAETDGPTDKSETKDINDGKVSAAAESQHLPELETEQLEIAQLTGTEIVRPTEMEGGIAAEEVEDRKTFVHEMPGHQMPLPELSGDVHPRSKLKVRRINR